MNGCPLNVLGRGDNWIAVDKPAGLSTISPPGGDSLEQRLRVQMPEASYLTAVHRLDRPVSGVVLVALSKRAARLLSAQFETRKVRKRYHARLIGRWEGERAVWEDHLIKRPGEARADVVTAEASQAKRAVTEVMFDRYDAASAETSVWLSPLTGRMHQLRIQAARRGHPIVGDLLYGGESSGEVDSTDQTFRIALRARELTFFDPRNGRRTTITAPADGDAETR